MIVQKVEKCAQTALWDWFLHSVLSKIAHKMENEFTYNLSIAKLRDNFPADRIVAAGDDFCMFNVGYSERLHALGAPCRVDGLTMLYCLKGHVKLSVNLNEYDVKDNDIIVVSPGNLLKVTDVPEQDLEQLKYVVVVMSARFCSELKFDLRKMLKDGLALMERPVVSLSQEMQALVGKHLSLMADIVQVDMPFKDDVLSSMASSMLGLVAGVWMESLDEQRALPSHQTTRSRMVFEQFIKLVAENHMKHRNVGFYADKLCLTPKYLSKLIKNASGKSAPEWIDAHVILEAKNLLKYSDITIKEIVYRLNFPNQSVFYKFFKARTGMTPSEYRNS